MEPSSKDVSLTSIGSPLIDLPQELIDRIFWFSADSRQACLDLCFVSSLAHRIALPHLLHTVVIKNHVANNRFRRILRLGASTRGEAFPLAPLVRNIWMEAVSEHIIDLFDTCNNLKHIALVDDVFLWLIRGIPTSASRWSNKEISSHAVARNEDLHVTFIKPRYGWEQRPMLSQMEDTHDHLDRFLSAITHIHLAGPPSFSTAFDDLSRFKRLSHFAFPCSSRTRLGTNMTKLLHIDSLKMIVVIVNQATIPQVDINELGSYVVEKRQSDPRIYLVDAVEDSGAGLRDLWDREVRGTAESLWERAVRFTGLLL